MNMSRDLKSERKDTVDKPSMFEETNEQTESKVEEANDCYEVMEMERAKKEPKNKPALSYIALISMAIQSSEEKKLLLSEIYHWISYNFPYYQSQDKSWRNSIRHNLSLNECFIKNGRCENGKGSYWSIHLANVEDFEQGDFRRRHARRRVKKCDEEFRKLTSVLCPDIVETQTINSPEMRSSTPLQSPSFDSDYNGYVPMTNVTMRTDELIAMFGVDTILSKEEQVCYFQKSADSCVQGNSSNVSSVISSDGRSANPSQNEPSQSQGFLPNYSYPSLIFSADSNMNS